MGHFTRESRKFYQGTGIDMEWIAAAVVGLAIVLACAWRPLARIWRRAEFDRARQQFQVGRERIEARFFQQAAESGKPAGLVWVDCEFGSEVTYARDRRSGELLALTRVKIRFEAIPGGPMEDVEAVGNDKFGSAVFFYRDHHWYSAGRTLFNLDPEEAIAYYGNDFEQLQPDPVSTESP